MDIFFTDDLNKMYFFSRRSRCGCLWNDNILDHFFCSSWNSSWIDQFSFCWKIWSWMLTFCTMGGVFIRLTGEISEIGEQCKCFFFNSPFVWESGLNLIAEFSAQPTIDSPKELRVWTQKIMPLSPFLNTISATKYWSVHFFCQFCVRLLEISF